MLPQFDTEISWKVDAPRKMGVSYRHYSVNLAKILEDEAAECPDNNLKRTLTIRLKNLLLERYPKMVEFDLEIFCHVVAEVEESTEEFLKK